MLIATILFFTGGNIKYNTAVNYNLQDYVVPLHYNVEIRYFLDDNILFGLCSIIVNITRPLNSIMLHSARIRVSDAILIDDKNNIAYKLDFSSWNKSILTLYFDKKQYLHSAVYSLNITYIRNVYKIKGDFFRYAYLEESRLRDQK